MTVLNGLPLCTTWTAHEVSIGTAKPFLEPIMEEKNTKTKFKAAWGIYYMKDLNKISLQN